MNQTLLGSGDNLLDYNIKRDFFEPLDNGMSFDISVLDENVILHIIDVFNLSDKIKDKYYNQLLENYNNDFYTNLSFTLNKKLKYDDDMQGSYIEYIKFLYENNDATNIYFESYKILLEISKILFCDGPHSDGQIFIKDRFRKRIGNDTKNERIDKVYGITNYTELIYQIKLMKLRYIDDAIIIAAYDDMIQKYTQ